GILSDTRRPVQAVTTQIPCGIVSASAVGYDEVPFEGSSPASAVFSLSPGRERVVGVGTALVVSDWIIRNTPARVSDWLRQESQERHLLSRRGVGDFLLDGGYGSRCVELENIISELCHIGVVSSIISSGWSGKAIYGGVMMVL
ncbi:hypothetical protein NPIL_667471, partial [Nephila pilipes]